jgi:hypothetical protein
VALAEECSPVVLRGFKKMTDARAFEPKAYDAGRVAPWIFEITHVVKAEAIMSMHDDGFFLSCEELDDNGIERNVPKVPCLSAACSEPSGSLLH